MDGLFAFTLIQIDVYYSKELVLKFNLLATAKILEVYISIFASGIGFINYICSLLLCYSRS